MLGKKRSVVVASPSEDRGRCAFLKFFKRPGVRGQSLLPAPPRYAQCRLRRGKVSTAPWHDVAIAPHRGQTMATFAQHFQLAKSQAELDFVDVVLETGNPFFVDPFAISQRHDRWGQGAHLARKAFFQAIIARLRAGRQGEARSLLQNLAEPNETRFGLSRGRPQGAGIGPGQADEIFRALSQSEAVRTGLLTSLEECELMVDGVSDDKISDLTTNVLRGQLAEYTQGQCDLHGIATRNVAVGPTFDVDQLEWVNESFGCPWRPAAPSCWCRQRSRGRDQRMTRNGSTEATRLNFCARSRWRLVAAW